MEAKQIPQVPVHVDSPMAIEAIQIFLKHSEEYTTETRDQIARYGSPLKWNGFFFDQKQEDSRKLNDAHYPMIIISSSGMVTGGRILHHLIHRLSDPKNTVIFIGFQSPGTRGAIIKSGASSVKIFGEEVRIRAQIAALEQFSDHADTPELLEWLSTFKQKPSQTYLVHGEPAAAAALRDAITAKLGWKVDVAQWLEKVEV
jgi:metallo-beta-lactamase family protein